MSGAALMLVFCLLAYAHCQAKPFKQSSFFDLVGEDGGSGVEPIEEKSHRPRYFCPPKCICQRNVVQCSNLGLTRIPTYILPDTSVLDLQNNKIREIKERDLKNLKNLLILIIVNNRLRRIHPKAFAPLQNLKRLYLSKNLLKVVPDNMPKSLNELHICDNKIKYVKKEPFLGMSKMLALEFSRNPMTGEGIEKGAFKGLKMLSYLRITETGLTQIPKDLPRSLTEIHLDRNKIVKVDMNDFKNLHNLRRLRLKLQQDQIFLQIKTLSHMPMLQDLHLDNNKLFSIPPGLPQHKNIMALYLNDNHIAHVRENDFCPTKEDSLKTPYSRISLYGNPIPYWEIEPGIFYCAVDWIFIQLERPT
eukprot:gi/632963306/ref/XP_007897806.1/ PREDICTED: decorin-like [Callorhinchus milii]